MKEILCFGDSNTYGLIPGTTRRYDRETRWTGILAEKLYDKGYRIIEEGLCGRTSVFDDATRDGRNGAKVMYESDAAMPAYCLEDYFEPSRFDGRELVQAVTLDFSAQE